MRDGVAPGRRDGGVPGMMAAEGVAAFARRFPVLFHVTDPAALPGIERNGLLSAAALVELYGVPEAERAALLEENRGKGRFHPLQRPGLPGAVLRDQWLPEKGLLACLGGRYAGQPREWRRLINDHAYFWLSAADATRLAGVNAARAQVVLRFDAAALLAVHGAAAWTTPINAGSVMTRRWPPSPRDESTLRPVSEFPRADRRKPRELAIRGGVPDAWRFRLPDPPG
ncbi:DUF7002 family protein [Roseomonas sp. BN140053]|uniref:DUF7002 family protein n=1 Tax=Roseomonas sp. BN140053 TaxID=3391898 RepID=UPI0039E7D5CC